MAHRRGGRPRRVGVHCAAAGAAPLQYNARRARSFCAPARSVLRSSCSYQVSVPGDLLQAHGIAVRKELPGVGANLQDHLQIRTVYKVRDAVTLNQRANSLFGKAMMGLEYLLFRTGPLTMAPQSAGCLRLQ